MTSEEKGELTDPGEGTGDDPGTTEAATLDAAAAELFPDEHPIFARKELLQIGHIPEGDRIVGRDEEIQSLANQLIDATQGNSPENVIIYGKTGTGKSLVSKYVTRVTKWKAERDSDVSVGTVYIDCAEDTTEAQTIATIASSLNNAGTEISIPPTGLSTGQYYKRLWSVMDALHDVVIVILDEVDMLDDDDKVVMKLTRAEEAGKVDCDIGLIAISNKIQYVEGLDERVKSSFQETELFFPPYDANQLREIMRNRADAFREDVLTDDVIPLCAAFAAQEHGDARRALDILRNAGKLAYERGEEQVTEVHVRDAQDLAEKERFRELIGEAPTQSKAVVLSLALLTISTEEDTFTTGDIFAVYKFICTQVDMDTLSERRVRDLISEQNFLEILYSEPRSRGRGGGRYNAHRLIDDAGLVKETILEDSRFDQLFSDVSEDELGRVIQSRV
ncbi:orc1/cdc6 family replication initiation protein [Haloarchaeobius sp. DFWS5]|uniref:orc1/cdc6 family replication initiation protein n=1 Tax=Haloarchaeobius sp. DFWS5 TaxID=3446114 RepID=UPI003EBDA2E0